MSEQRRWDASKQARRDDQFVRPPAFRDGHDSEPLRAEQAKWHGHGSRGVAFAAVLAVFAGLAAVAFMAFVGPGSPEAGSPASPLGAEGEDGVPGGDAHVPAADGNATRLPPLPTPLPSSAPGLPTLPAAPT